MIKIDALSITEFRGIRELEISLGRESFVVYGPNGSGKSGIVDAIQFALTGTIGRLVGTGTSELTIGYHGPHILARSNPETAKVRLTAFIPSLNVTATIERNLKKPTQPKISPNDPKVRAVFDQIAMHPEISLSRREIIKYILNTDGERSKDVQTLLRLSEIGEARAALKTAQNKIEAQSASATAVVREAKLSLGQHLGISALKAADILLVVNARRSVLSLEELTEFTSNTRLNDGLPAQDKLSTAPPSREVALNDVIGLLDALANTDTEGLDAEVAVVRDGLLRLATEPELELAIRRLQLLEIGIELVDADECPLCENAWDATALRTQLLARLEASREASMLKSAIETSAQSIAFEAERLSRLAGVVQALPEATAEEPTKLSEWKADLDAFAISLKAFDGIRLQASRIEAGWKASTEDLIQAIALIRTRVAERPIQSAIGAARDFLTVADERLARLKLQTNEARLRESDAARARLAYDIYVNLADSSLTSLYTSVEQDFATYYRTINSDDEETFSARLTPSDASLRLDVDFFGHGLCSPGAYHSEGHQDGMGLCLYLALAKQSLGNDMSLVVLDDVVMSVDSGHRRNICRLLKNAFPNTQFVITTHDEVWARQTRSEGLISSRKMLAFHSWSVETGPVVHAVSDVWRRIEVDLIANDVAGAAVKLRRHLEFVAGELADLLVAAVPYRGDNSYDFGDLFPPVLARQKTLLGLAAKSANSWNNKAEVERIKDLQDRLRDIQTQQSDESWMVNKSVHYNEWANLTAAEFKPLVKAYEDLLMLWKCVACDSWLGPTSRHNPQGLRCACDSFRFNLSMK